MANDWHYDAMWVVLERRKQRRYGVICIEEADAFVDHYGPMWSVSKFIDHMMNRIDAKPDWFSGELSGVVHRKIMKGRKWRKYGGVPAYRVWKQRGGRGAI